MPPKAPLQRVIIRCYDVFAVYPQPAILHASGFKNATKFLSDLTSAPLWKLGEDKIGPYAGSALLTVGDVGDYKHFLPRILEQAVCRSNYLGTSPEIIAERLKLGNWKTWPSTEQKIILDFFDEAWSQVICEPADDEDVESWLCAIAILDLNLPTKLETWINEPSFSAVLHLANFIQLAVDSIFALKEDDRILWQYVDEISILLMRNWLLDDVVSSQLQAARGRASSSGLWEIEQALRSIKKLRSLRVQ